MALPKFNKDDPYLSLPAETLIDVVAFQGDKVVVREMTYKKYRTMKKVKGWNYRSFQKGFHSYKNTE